MRRVENPSKSTAYILCVLKAGARLGIIGSTVHEVDFVQKVDGRFKELNWEPLEIHMNSTCCRFFILAPPLL